MLNLVSQSRVMIEGGGEIADFVEVPPARSISSSADQPMKKISCRTKAAPNPPKAPHLEEGRPVQCEVDPLSFRISGFFQVTP